MKKTVLSLLLVVSILVSLVSGLSFQANASIAHPHSAISAVSLRTCELIESGRGYESFDEILTDSTGGSHQGSIKFVASYNCYASYKLGQQFDTFKGAFGADTRTGDGALLNVRIYCDGSLVHSITEIPKSSAPVPFEIDVRDVDVLRIETSNTGAYYYGDVYLVDDELSCSPSTTSSQGVCLAELECVDEGHYTGNMGDARVYKLDATAFTGYHPLGYNDQTKAFGNVGVDGTVYENGFEVWIARWNFGDNISWAYRTFKLDGEYHTLTGSSGIIRSNNTTNYNVTVYFYNGEELLHSFQMTPSSNQFDFSIDVSGVDELKVLVKDNVKTSAGTSYALYNLYLDKGSSLSDEITHLIFADMAYDLAKNDVRTDPPKTVSEYVSEGHGSTEPLYKNSTFSQRDAFNLVGDWVIRDVDYGNKTNEAAGYAAAVFQKGDQIVIAFRGSEDGPLSAFKGEDWTVDFQFALFNYLNPDQFGAALNTYKRYAGKYNITLTGHSLGGALATYVSILTGAKAYTFDGADGHVIDLTYLLEFKEIDFTSKYEMQFANYTDPESLTGKFADLIQHTNTGLMYGYCYNTNHDINLPSNYNAVPTHYIYSNTQLVNGFPEFTELGETHVPKENWYASIDFSYLGILIGGAGGLLSGGFEGMIQWGKVGGNVGRLFKKGNVILGTSGNDTLTVNAAVKSPLDLTAHYTVNAIYGGNGTDKLCGSFGNDILVSGKLNGDLLVGSEGRDTYVLDCSQGGSVFIADLADGNEIILKGSDYIGTQNVKYVGKDGKYHVYRVNDSVTISILHTWVDHDFALTDITGSEICTITSHGSVKFSGGGGGGGGGRSVRSTTCEEAPTKNVSIAGASSVDIFDENGNLLGTYSIDNPGLYCEEYGVIIVQDDDIYASIYDSCTLQASGKGESDFYIIGTDTEGNVLQAAVASDINLDLGSAFVEPEIYAVSQNNQSVASEQIHSSTGVCLNTTSVSMQVEETAALNAEIEFTNGAGSTEVCWISSDPNIVACEYDMNGNCTITAVNCGTATVVAVAEDSGHYAECEVTVTCKGGETCPGNKFSDMPAKGNWAHDPIDWAVVSGITTGTSATTFSPAKTCTRCEVVTFLWRANGCPEPTTTDNPFTDVPEGSFYYKAVLWAVEKGITSGTGGKTFSPKRECTRSEVVTFLWRAAGKPEPTTTDNPFKDVVEGSFYYKAVLWAVENHITSGTSKTAFTPKRVCTRGEVVTFLYRAES